MSIYNSYIQKFVQLFIFVLLLSFISADPLLIDEGLDLGGYLCDEYTWTDSNGSQRKAAMVRNTQQDPSTQGPNYGGYMRRYIYDIGGVNRECISTSNRHPGFGMVINHYNGGSTSSARHNENNTTSIPLQGENHAIHRYTWTYIIHNGYNIDFTVEWFFATGRDHPVWSVTFDCSNAPADAIDADTRAPYGDIQWTGNSSDNVDGVGWGDRYKFTSLDSPITMNSGWDYSEPNTVPYVIEWADASDAEMGCVQTQTYLQHDAGGYWFYGSWGTVDADGPMPEDWNWTYQLNQYELPWGSTSKRLAWGSNYGAVGQNSYNAYGDDRTLDGYPYQSYSVHVVLGRHSDQAVFHQVTQVETVQNTSLNAIIGNVIAQGPAGIARTDNVTYEPAGYNHIFGTWELQAQANICEFDLSVSSGQLENPIIVIHNYSSSNLPQNLTIGGNLGTINQDYFPTLDDANDKLWITLSGSFTGTTNIRIEGTPDETAPIISNINVTNILASSATITWQTDENANSRVDYGLDAGYGNFEDNANYVTNHSVTLNGLLPETTYHFQITSVDGSNNSSTSTDQSFITEAPDITSPVITNVQVVNINSTNATITWDTDEPADSLVEYGETISYGNTESDTSYVTSHSIIINGLNPETTYHYMIKSKDEANNESQTSDAEFITIATPPEQFDIVYDDQLASGWDDNPWDTTYNLSNTSPVYSGSNSIEINFNANWAGIEFINSTFEYTKYENLYFYINPGASVDHFDVLTVAVSSVGANNPSLFIQNYIDSPTIESNTWYLVSLPFSELNPNNNVCDRIIFMNMSGSGYTHNFYIDDLELGWGGTIDTTPPVVSNVLVDNLTHTSVSISFATDEFTICSLGYGIGSITDTIDETQASTQHEIILTGLNSDTTYQFEIIANDLASPPNVSTYSDTFFTSEPVINPVNITIDSTLDVHPISPYIYGQNMYGSWDAQRQLFISWDESLNLPFAREGGNRWSAYNWETNYSNAGIDYGPYSSDTYLCSNQIPGDAVLQRVNIAHNDNASILVTIPLLGQVAADASGPIGDPAGHFHTSHITKPGDLLLTPDTTDNVVYQEEFVNWFETTYYPSGRSGNPLQVFYSLGNEPALWAGTHDIIHPDPVSYNELITKSIEAGSMIKEHAPEALVFGPALYGWLAFVNLQEAPDASTYGDFIDFYLTQMQAEENANGTRLLDVLDLHWYPEAQGGGTRILGDDNNAPEVVAARLQAPRSLWDDTYTEESWIASSLGGEPINLIPRINAQIDANYPGTKLAFTEYHYGGGNHISGGIAQADVLGIFGRENIFAATIWGLSVDGSNFTTGGFRVFRNYDGNRSSFGDTSIQANTDNIHDSSIYASINTGDPNKMIIVIINKTEEEMNASININHSQTLNTARVYQLTSSNIEPQYAGEINNIIGNSFNYIAPPMSVSTIELINSNQAINIQTILDTMRQRKAGSITDDSVVKDQIEGYYGG